MNRILKPLDRAAITTFLVSFVSGVYLGTFYIFNNLTMLNLEGIVFILAITTLPMLTLSIIFYFPFHLVEKENLAKSFVIFIRFAVLFFFLRPTLLGFEFVSDFFALFPSSWQLITNMLFVFVLALPVTLLFRKYDYIFGVMIFTMLLAAILMNFPKLLDNSGKSVLTDEVSLLELSETPNIYFILADGLGSMAYMNEQGIDVSGLESFLHANQFSVYSDTFSNYQPTTSAMSAILEMEHHYYSLSGWQVDFSEVNKAARTVIGGENRLTKILKRNGYIIQYNHGGTYLMLQGCSADICFPKPHALEGARLILSHIFNMDLLSDTDKIWSTISDSELLANAEFLMESNVDQPHFQYIHHYEPGHAPSNVVGKCDEEHEKASYAERVAFFGKYLRSQITDIVTKDPRAVIIIAGDHGPFISKKCNLYAYIDSEPDYRDRAGAFMSVRWPEGYDGKYDNRIKTGVNLFRYLLASLSEESEVLLNAAAPDDVYTRAGEQVFKVIEDGKILPVPIEYLRTAHGNEYNRLAGDVPCNDAGRGSEINQGLCFYNNGELRSALNLFEKVLKKNPEDAVAWNNVCATHNRLRQYDYAIHACEMAVELAPDFKLARNNLAWAKSQAVEK